MQRSKPLTRTQRPRRRKKPITYSKPYRGRVPLTTRAEVRARADFKCERCGTPDYRFACQAHHVILRSRGGTNDASNLKWLCWRCHRWVHDNPAASTAAGFMSRLGAQRQPNPDEHAFGCLTEQSHHSEDCDCQAGSGTTSVAGDSVTAAGRRTRSRACFPLEQGPLSGAVMPMRWEG